MRFLPDDVTSEYPRSPYSDKPISFRIFAENSNIKRRNSREMGRMILGEILIPIF